MKRREALAAGEGTLRNAMHPSGTAGMSFFLVLAMGFGATLLGKRCRYYTYGTIVIQGSGSYVFGGQNCHRRAFFTRSCWLRGSSLWPILIYQTVSLGTWMKKGIM